MISTGAVYISYTDEFMEAVIASRKRSIIKKKLWDVDLISNK